jgi:hypothetical protein
MMGKISEVANNKRKGISLNQLNVVERQCHYLV